MKHTIPVTLLLLGLFFVSQVLGLFIVNASMQETVDDETGQVTISYDDTAIGPRPEVENQGMLLYLLVAILIGTLLVLLIVKFRKARLWKLWFFFAVWMTISISFGVFIESWIALALAFIVAWFKLWKPNPVIHNISELFMYAGIAVFLVPKLNIYWAGLLLIIIAVYDYIAVYKSKHMVHMAKFQAESKLFAGFLVPYKGKDKQEREKKKQAPKKKVARNTRAEKEIRLGKGPGRMAILGGGDVAFPMLFAAVAMQRLIDVVQLSKASAYFLTLVIPVFVTLALGWLFWQGQKDKFYPAMPIVTAGCFIGYGVLALLLLI